MAKPRSKKKSYKIYFIYTLLIVALLVTAFFITKRFAPSEAPVAAVVNGEQITEQNLAEQYNRLPDQYKLLITKEQLLDQLINTKLLLQEAKNKGISVTSTEIDAEIEGIKTTNLLSDEGFNQLLAKENISLADLRQQLQDQLLVNKLLQQEIFSKIEVTEQKVLNFYEQKKEAFGNVSYDDVKEQINESLLNDISKGSVELYINQLRAKASITKGGEKEAVVSLPQKIVNFTETNDAICTEEGKPILRLYTTSKCTPCAAARQRFEAAVQAYTGKIVAYVWELDTGDNLLTSVKEQAITTTELEIFKKYNQKSTVPTVVLGCKYVAIGAASLPTQVEFTNAIEELLK